MSVTAIVLCGGTSARMGGADKTAMDLGDTSVLGSLVGSLPADWQVVCVGEPRPLAREVTWVREDPPLGGPVAGLAAGVAAAPDQARVVVVLAGDQPFAGATAASCVEALTSAPDDQGGVCALQEDGRLQPLLAAYRRGPLSAALAAAPSDSGVYAALSALRVGGVHADAQATLDVDTPADLDEARRLT